MTPAPDPWAQVAAAAAAIVERTGIERHEVLVVLGSGWASAADCLGEPVVEVAVEEVPGFASTGTDGHHGMMRSVATADGRRILVLLGRVHAYEGHELSTVVHAVRVAARVGCGTIVLTNAAGGLRAGMAVGQPVLIADHLNLTGASPLSGPAPPAELGLGRFVDLTHAYSPRLRAIARSVDPTLPEAVYAGLPGPHYETLAEIAMLRTLGADLVGMSTVHEVIAARQVGAEVLGLSLVTNLAAGLGEGDLDHAAVVAAGAASASAMGELVAAIVARL